MDRNRKLIIDSIRSGRIFSVTFVKRSDGTERRMTARLGVTKHLQGGERAYDASDENLIVVFDLQKKEYRAIPVEGILSMRVDGQVYTWPAIEASITVNVAEGIALVKRGSFVGQVKRYKNGSVKAAAAVRALLGSRWDDVERELRA